MDPKENEELCNTEPEDETIARQKKRSRRVSFAEITSVHVFDRDEDYETPPDSKPSSENLELGQTNEPLTILRDYCDSDDSRDLSQIEDEDDDDDDDDDEERELFARSVDSSSPGSAIGSVTSNDEDNFFGPVSASFIRSGRLSDSAASDDNREITLDSTAFSMHFHSLVPSDSEGKFKTPTTFEEKTPTENSIRTGLGSSMVLTGVRKPIPHCSASGGKSNSGYDSNDMSLIEENPHRYDYGRLSPTLDALLAEGNKDLRAVSVSEHINIPTPSNYLNRESRFPSLSEHDTNLMAQQDTGDMKLGNIKSRVIPAETVSDASNKLCETNSGSATIPIEHSYGCSSSTKDAPLTVASIGHKNQSLKEPTPDTPFDTGDESREDALEASGSELVLAAGNTDTLTPVDKMLQMDMIIESDYRSLGCSESLMREESPKDGRHTPNTGQNSDKHCGSPLVGSLSSLCAERGQIFLDSDVSSRKEWLSTPYAGKQVHSSFSQENVGHGKSVSSIKKSISKFKILETPPSAAIYKVRVENSTQTLSDDFSKPLAFVTVLDENIKDRKLKQVDIPVTPLEGHYLSVPQKEREQNIKMDTYKAETPKNVRILRQIEERTSIMHDGGCRDQITAGLSCDDQPSKLMASQASPFQFSVSGKQMHQNPLASRDPIGVAFFNSDSGRSLKEITLDLKESKQVTGTLDKFICDPAKGLEKKLYALPEHESLLTRTLNLQDQNNQIVSMGLRQDGVDSSANATNLSQLTSTDNLDSLLEGKRTHPNSPFTKLNSNDSIHFGKCKGVSDKQLDDLQKESGEIGKYQTPPRFGGNLASGSRSPGRIFQTGTDPARMEGKLAETKFKTSSDVYASPYISRRTSTARQSGKILMENLAQSPFMKELYNLSNNDNARPFAGKDPLSPKSIQCSNKLGDHDCHQSLYILQQPFSAQDVENYGRKRRSEEFIVMEDDHIDEIGRIRKSPKVLEIDGHASEIPSEHCIVGNYEAEKIGRCTTVKHWADIFSKLSSGTTQLLPPLTDKLESSELDILEDILSRLEKSKKYEELCPKIWSQNLQDHLGNLQQKRVVEARWLPHMLVYKQAKLQLMRVRRERLLKRIQLLQSGIQESQILKSNALQHVSAPEARYAQNKGNHLPFFSVNSRSKNEDSCNKVTTLRHEFGALDQKIKNLTRSFHASCKIKGERSSCETIQIVNDHLKMKTYFRIIRQDLQLWDNVDLESKNGYHDVVLSYFDSLYQRFRISIGPVSGILASNKLNDMNIIKKFPNLNACTAFAFVLNAETARKLNGPKSLAQETQITSFLLGNLLDVIDEVEVACVELPNLIQTSFHSPCDEQLDLQLCFVDFRTGRKVSLTLDMTSLNCGVYPSQITPSQLQAQTHETPPSPLSPPLLSAEIEAAVVSLKAGHLRILRLCRCVSQVVQPPS